MKGTMIKITPDGIRETIERNAAPTIEWLKDGIGGGYIELVPGFTTIRHQGKITACVAFVDEDGKYKKMPTNQVATGLWDEALRRNGHPGLITPDRRVADHIVGTIAIVMGDTEFRELL